jgi:hypothetical protein
MPAALSSQLFFIVTTVGAERRHQEHVPRVLYEGPKRFLTLRMESAARYDLNAGCFERSCSKSRNGMGYQVARALQRKGNSIKESLLGF